MFRPQIHADLKNVHEWDILVEMVRGEDKLNELKRIEVAILICHWNTSRNDFAKFSFILQKLFNHESLLCLKENIYVYIYISIFRQTSFYTLLRIIRSNAKQSGIVPLKQGHLAFILPRGILDTISLGKAFFRILIEKYQMFILHIERYRLGAHLKKCK